MAKLIPPGGFDVPESDYPVPETGLTRAAVRHTLGPPVVAYPTPRGGWLFCRSTTDQPFNCRAAALCGRPVCGPALRVGPGERVNWHDADSLPE